MRARQWRHFIKRDKAHPRTQERAQRVAFWGTLVTLDTRGKNAVQVVGRSAWLDDPAATRSYVPPLETLVQRGAERAPVGHGRRLSFQATFRAQETASIKRLEVVFDHVAADFPPEVRSFLARVAEVGAGQSPGVHHVLDRVVEALVIARRAGDPTIERESNLVGAEEGAERVCHGAAVEGVRCRVLGMVRRRTQRLPVGLALNPKAPPL
jgi:hypothetical protein